MKNFTLIYFLALFFLGTNASAKIIQPGMIDTFEDGTTNSWVKGPNANSDLAPQNVANADESNRFLEVKSYGPGTEDIAPGSRMVFFNEKQWAGDYTNISSISLNVRAESLSEEYLYMRLAIYDTPDNSKDYSRYVSSTSQQLKTDGQWHLITLSLAADDLTRFRGEKSALDVLTNVSQLRFLSNKDSASSWAVDKISATLAVDNITAVAAVPLPASAWLLFSGIMGLLGMKRKRLHLL